MYELIDFGEGRRLERFGEYLLDRPAAGTEGIARDAQSLALWSQAAARFEQIGGIVVSEARTMGSRRRAT